MTIRPYTPLDKKDLLLLLKSNTPQYFAPSEENDFIDYLDKHAEAYFVAEENGIIIGSGGINYFRPEQLARLSWDIIHPEHQGKGIGKQLTLYRIAEIKKDPSLRQIVVRTSQLAYQFYEKMGFELEKVEKDYWAEGLDLYYMRLT